MTTAAATRATLAARRIDTAVTSLSALIDAGCTTSGVRAQLAAGRWQRMGRAVILHNGPPTVAQTRVAMLINLGPRALLTSFTALEDAGMAGWARDAVHVLVPRGARIRRPAGVPVRVHYTDAWPLMAGRRDGLGHAAVLAASSFASTRPACGLLAATVQQRLIRASDLITAVEAASCSRHRRALLAAARDIAQGADALSEVDFARLCRHSGLPEPVRQAPRREPSGRRRYLDAEWRSRSGRRVVAEVDGALHLIVGRWWDDQLRQNELAIAGDVVLRFPTVIVRHEPAVVVDQLRRVLAT